MSLPFGEDVGRSQPAGPLQVLGGIGLLLPLFAGIAAVCLAALMIGAMSVELFVVEGGNAVGPLLCFVLSVAIAQ